MATTSSAGLSDRSAIVATVVDIIRSAVDEPWIIDFEIGAHTNIHHDLELESLEVVVIAEKLQAHFGREVDFVGWFSKFSLHQMIDLTVGDIADFIAHS